MKCWILFLIVFPSCAILNPDLKKHTVNDHLSSLFDEQTFSHVLKDHQIDFSKYRDIRTTFSNTGRSLTQTDFRDIQFMEMLEAQRFRFAEIGHITIKARKASENYELLILLLRMEAAEVGADTIINVKKETTRPGKPSNLKQVSGLAVKLQAF